MTDVLDDVKLDKCKILIVDDIQDNVIMLGAHLKSKGYNVITANNGVKALSLAVQESPDLIMMDINMPQLSGLDACAQLKQNTATRNIPVILVTAHSDVDDIVTGFEVGADDYLIKPYNYMEMQARVRSMLRVRKFQEELLIANKKLDEINHSLEEKVKQQVSELERANKLRRFFSPQIVETIVGDNETMLNEHRREISVVFLDLRNFTSFAEQNDAAKVIQTVNELHSTVGPLIFKHRGTLERFTGDGMMVFLGDPEPIPDHPEKAVEMRDKYGLDGAMIGRASIGNPWFFNHVKHYFKTAEHLPYPMIDERIDLARRHLEMSIKWKGEKLGVLETRRHYSNYFKGIPDFKKHRTKMVTCDYSAQLFDLFDELKVRFKNKELAY